MIGKRSAQRDIFDARSNVYPLELKTASFYAQLARVAPTLFSDQEFLSLYSEKLSRPSTPPSQLALLLIPQTYDKVSDFEAVEHSAYDLRWCAVLGKAAGEQLCAKSRLQLFRAHLLLHKQFELIFKWSLTEARKNKLLKRKSLMSKLQTQRWAGTLGAGTKEQLSKTSITQAR